MKLLRTLHGTLRNKYPMRRGICIFYVIKDLHVDKMMTM